MSQITISNQVTCASLGSPTTISPFECIGDSLATINRNFSLLKSNETTICEALSANTATTEQIVIAPVGTIVAWSGEIRDNSGATITASSLTAGTSAFIYAKQAGGGYAVDRNWAVCTGVTVYGETTPNLIGRFIVGAGNPPTDDTFNDDIDIYNSGDIGGTEAITLEQVNIPKFTDTVTIGSQSDQEFVKPFTLSRGTTRKYTSGDDRTFLDSNNFIKGPTSWSPDTATVQTGGSDTVEIGQDSPTQVTNLPPYYGLYYIMRVS